MKGSIDDFNTLSKLSVRILSRVTSITVPKGADACHVKDDLLTLCTSEAFHLRNTYDDAANLWNMILHTPHLPEVLQRCGQWLYIFISKDDEDWVDLINRLASGMTVHVISVEDSLLDEASVSAIPEYADLVSLLTANPWLVYLHILTSSDYFKDQ